MYTLEYLVYHLRPFGTTGTSHYSAADNNTSADDVQCVQLPTSGQPASVTAGDRFMKSAATNLSYLGSNVLSPGRAVSYVYNSLSDSERLKVKGRDIYIPPLTGKQNRAILHYVRAYE